jgi:adenylate kinase family enzyme
LLSATIKDRKRITHDRKTLRINVIGTSGSGKTTFGRELASVLQIPFIELDAIFWGPDWSEPDDSELFPKLSAALSGDNWVLDGNYSRTLDIKWERVDSVIWLDFSFPRTVAQAIKRAVSRIITQEELWTGTGNRESLQKLFSRDSIVLWTIQTYATRRKRIQGYITSGQYRSIIFHRIKSPKQAKIFLQSVARDPVYVRNSIM